MPQTLFMSDFLALLPVWMGRGERLNIFTDMNEHILTGPLARRMLALGLKEATHKAWDGDGPHSYIDGKRPIDGVYHISH